MDYDRSQWCRNGPFQNHYQNGYETQNGFLTALQGEHPPHQPPCYENNYFEEQIPANGNYHYQQGMVNCAQIPVQNVQTVDESLSSLLQEKEHYSNQYDPYNQYEAQYYYNHDYYYQEDYHFYQNYDQNNVVYNNYPTQQFIQPPPAPEPPPQEPTKRTYDCTMCNQKFDHHYALKRHMRRKDHLNEKTFKCKICGVAFALEQNLTRHYNTLHKKNNEKLAVNGLPSVMSVMAETNNSRKLSDLVTGLMELFECNHCKEVFHKYDAYRTHVTSQHPELKKFTCPHRHCDADYDALDDLIEHIKSHTVIKPEPNTKRLRCTVCNKDFTRSDALRYLFLLV